MTGVFRRVVPLCLAAALVACGGGDASTPVAAPAPTDASTATTAAATAGSIAGAPSSAATPDGSSTAADVPAALQLTAPLVGGGEIELGAFAGRPVLLWFWAPW